MIPVTQTKVVVKNSKDELVVRGNCFAACIASIIEKPIEEVPNVETLFHINSSFWIEVMLAYLNSIGWDLCSDDMFKRFHPDLFGYDFRGTDENGKIPQYYEYKDKYYLVSGKSARGVNHVCIYQNGILIHDPHPTKEGLITLEYFESLEKMNSEPTAHGSIATEVKSGNKKPETKIDSTTIKP